MKTEVFFIAWILGGVAILIFAGWMLVQEQTTDKGLCSIPVTKETFYTIEENGDLTPATFIQSKIVPYEGRCPRIDEYQYRDYHEQDGEFYGPVPGWADEDYFRETGRLRK